MDARRALAALLALAVVALLLLRAVAPTDEEVCGPDAIECWPVLRLVAQNAALALAGVTIALLLALAPSRWAAAAGFAIALVAGAFLLFASVFSSPTTGCQGSPCVPTTPLLLAAGSLWGAGLAAVGGALASRAPRAAGLLAGAVGGAALVLVGLLLAGWP